MSEVVGSVHIDFGVRLGQLDLALRRGYTQGGGLEVRAFTERLSLQIFLVRFEGLIRKFPQHIKVCRHGVVTQKLPERYQRLGFSETSRRHIGLKLQQLKFDLEIVGFADRARLKLRVRNVDRVFEALQIVQREAQSRFSQQNAYELLSNVEGQTAFRIGDLGTSDGGLIASGLQTPLPLVSTLEEI